MTELFTRRKTLILERGKERVIANRHPWIFAGAIHAEHGPSDAAFADLVDSTGQRLASGFYSEHSQIRLRALTFAEELNEELLVSRIVAAIARRSVIFDEGTNAARLIHAEGDELSSIVVDRYGDVLVVEIANRGAEQVKQLIIDVLQRELSPRVIFFRNDLPARRIERLPMDEEVIEPAMIVESGLQFRVDAAGGQKTGFFLDQRENRRLTRTLSGNRRVLNLFSYTGAFGVYAASGGASFVRNVDVSARAIELAGENHALNDLPGEHTVADAFQYVRTTDERYDLVVCDPPAFAKSRHDVERAARGYKDVNLHAMKLVEPGGMMLTFSCSGHMPLDLFQKVIFAAAIDAGRRVSFVRRLGAGPDHPVSLFAPEGEYLKGFLLEIR